MKTIIKKRKIINENGEFYFDLVDDDEYSKEYYNVLVYKKVKFLFFFNIFKEISKNYKSKCVRKNVDDISYYNIKQVVLLKIKDYISISEKSIESKLKRFDKDFEIIMASNDNEKTKLERKYKLQKVKKDD